MEQRRRAGDTKLMEIGESLSSLHTKYDTMHNELLGNGQPGRIQRVEADVKEQGDALEMLRGRLKYAAGGLAFAMLLLHLFLEGWGR